MPQSNSDQFIYISQSYTGPTTEGEIAKKWDGFLFLYEEIIYGKRNVERENEKRKTGIGGLQPFP